MNYLAAWNAVESGLWFVLAILVTFLGARVEGMTWAPRIGLSVGLVAFGVSDLIEMRTGAWWNPPGLMAFKAACLATILGSGGILRRNRRRADPLGGTALADLSDLVAPEPAPEPEHKENPASSN
jgi:hypothetical protein